MLPKKLACVDTSPDAMDDSNLLGPTVPFHSDWLQSTGLLDSNPLGKKRLIAKFWIQPTRQIVFQIVAFARMHFAYYAQ